jgi:poly(U)-specific endoribonuclease
VYAVSFSYLVSVKCLYTVRYADTFVPSSFVSHRPKPIKNGVPFNGKVVERFYRSIYDGLAVDLENNDDSLKTFFTETYHADLKKFFTETRPPEPGALALTRATAFKVGCDYLTDNEETNIELLRCINVVVHTFETSCLQPKPFHLQRKDKVKMKIGLSDAVQRLWNLDDNRLTPNEDMVVNVQKGKKPFWKEEGAQDPLFTSVEKEVWRRPTYAAFVALLDNYITGSAEIVTDTERCEITNFLNAIMETAPMQFCHKYCHAKDPEKVPPLSDRRGFIKLLHKIWFELYPRERGGRMDSSGFENVFVGEAKNGKVTGLHNWIQFYLEEQKGALDYHGYIRPRGNSKTHPDCNDYLLTLQFAWNGIQKFVGTSFVGVSPEFEMALYTMCFLVGGEINEVELNTGTDTFCIVIKCYKMADDKIGASFPKVTRHYDL